MQEITDKHQRTIDLGVAWTWPYDLPFVMAVREACATANVSLLEITVDTVEQVTRDVLEGSLRLEAFFDRASDEDDSFHSLATALLKDHRLGGGDHTMFINAKDDARRAADKATMHLEFITHGIQVPHTIILAPYAEEPDLSISEDQRAPLGNPFVVKPANTTGGGTGVIMNATSLNDIQRHRMTYDRDKYLLQERISPVYLSESRAWFRAFFAFGDTRLCWWDDETHVYDDVTSDEERWFGLHTLREALHTIAGLCRLDFFSSEFAQTADESFISVDYVNELCDMRPKSKTPDGVPDGLVAWVADRMAHHVRGKVNSLP